MRVLADCVVVKAFVLRLFRLRLFRVAIVVSCCDCFGCDCFVLRLTVAELRCPTRSLAFVLCLLCATQCSTMESEQWDMYNGTCTTGYVHRDLCNGMFTTGCVQRDV
jgi:hypothetical protein